MPVRFVVAPHAANPVYAPGMRAHSAVGVLETTWGRSSMIPCGELLQSSAGIPEHWPTAQVFDALIAPTKGSGTSDTLSPGDYLPSVPQKHGPRELSQLIPVDNGFIDTVVRAYNQHHHLIIRPDDVWIAILSQFNLYVNANADALRKYFVAHEGKKPLIVMAAGDRYSVDFGSLAQHMTTEIDENVLDKELKDWILPDFTTTTESDIIISAVMMMSTLKSYFAYCMGLTCGIPSVTLEGEREDWGKLLIRIERLKLFGKEPEAWAALLRPVLTRFVQAFDGRPDKDFWGHICHYRNLGSGSDDIGGWITAFCAWDKNGKWQRAHSSVGDILTGEERFRPEPAPTHTNGPWPGKWKRMASSIQRRLLTTANRDTANLTTNSRSHSDGSSGKEEVDDPCIRSDPQSGKVYVDGIPYPTMDTDDIAPGYCEVDVKLNDNGQIFDCMMVSGHMAVRTEGTSNDTVRPHPAWFMFIKGEEKKSSRGY